MQVFIVAGGYDGSLPYLSSTEMLIGEDATEWTWGAELPSRRIGLRGVSVANRFLLTGIGGSEAKVLKITFLRHPYSLVLFRNIYWWIYNILFRQKYFVAGGESNNKILDEVLMLTKDGKNWTQTTMKYARENHAVSVVPEDIKNYCQ